MGPECPDIVPVPATDVRLAAEQLLEKILHLSVPSSACATAYAAYYGVEGVAQRVPGPPPEIQHRHRW